jgi:hypothetical protein
MERMISPEKIIEPLSLLVDCYFNNSSIVSKYLITDVKILHESRHLKNKGETFTIGLFMGT